MEKDILISLLIGKTVGLLAKRRSEHHNFTWPELDEYLRDPLSDCVNELREVQEIS